MAKKKRCNHKSKSPRKYTKTYYCEDTKETCVGYDNYLKTKHWKQLRKKLVPKDHKCAVCGKSNKIIHLHHITYDRVGHELPTDLILLCEKCHNYIHSNGYADGFTGTIQEIIYLKQQMGLKDISYTKSKNITAKCESCQGCIWYYNVLTDLKKRNSSKKPFCFKHKRYDTIRCSQFSIYANYGTVENHKEDDKWMDADDFFSAYKKHNYMLPKKKR